MAFGVGKKWRNFGRNADNSQECNCNDNISNAAPTSRPMAHYIVHKCLFIRARG